LACSGFAAPARGAGFVTHPFVWRRLIVSISLAFCLSAGHARAATIYATGQNNGDPSHTSGNYYYAIDTTTGKATAISPLINGSTPAGLASSGDGRLLGFKDGQVGEVNPVAGTFTPSTPSNGLSITGFDVVNGFGYGIPTTGSDRRLQRIDLTTGAASPLGTGNPIGSALDTYFGDAPGTNSPFVISLGSVGGSLYGVHLGSGKNNLIQFDTSTGNAIVIGAPNAVATSGNPGAGSYSGFAALTGVDENGDGTYDALFGNVNFYDPDAGGPLASQRLGGLVRYNLADGTWTLVGTNPGLIFFGFGSIVPAPSATALAAVGALAFARRRRT
jgi:MprA protease rhombosortase-interaction domain-containing protein